MKQYKYKCDMFEYNGVLYSVNDIYRIGVEGKEYKVFFKSQLPINITAKELGLIVEVLESPKKEVIDAKHTMGRVQRKA